MAVAEARPTGFLFLDAVDTSGSKVSWKFEGYPPSALSRTGWKREVTVKPGDTIDVSGTPHKGGSHILQIRKLIAPDGKELPMFEN